MDRRRIKTNMPLTPQQWLVFDALCKGWCNANMVRVAATAPDALKLACDAKVLVSNVKRIVKDYGYAVESRPIADAPYTGHRRPVEYRVVLAEQAERAA